MTPQLQDLVELPTCVEHHDGATGVTERIELVPGPRGGLYTWIGRPDEASAVVVICSPLFADFAANYHRERLLGQALVAKGLAVVRFHYSGEGNSDGDASDSTYPSLCNDAETVVAHATEVLGVERVAFVGTRLGALVAAAVADTCGPAPLVLWEPMADADRFFADVFRAKRFSEIAQAEATGAQNWRDELAQNGRLEVVGYTMSGPLVESLDGVTLPSLLNERQTPMYIAWLDSRTRPQPRRATFIDEGRLDVEQRTFVVPDSWAFHDERVGKPGELIDATADWLVAATEGAGT